MKKLAVIFVLLLVGANTLTAQSKAERKALREEKALKAYEEVKELVASGVFTFVGEWANPISGPRITLIGNPNHLKISEGRVDAYLPYFGVRFTGGGFGESGGVKFMGAPKNYEVVEDDKKRRIIIKFNAENKQEHYDLILTISGGGNTTISLTSSSRSSITYMGEIGPPEDLE
ncbi:DUF4251 domain-containing protein [Spongiimicrobium sp. 3-5]|uniref:DUF4251 domain-containing protein n=1 Tax=Spongiimicrobium sp. 3-5 TaxID=3332596 RepID=UPI00397EC126